MSISVFLIAASLMTAAMTSCGGAGDTEAPVTDGATVAETAAVTEAVETRAPHAVPVDTLDFGGEELNMSFFDWQGYRFYFFAEEENGEGLNDAVFRRNIFLNEECGIVIGQVLDSDPNSKVRNCVAAQDGIYDVMYTRTGQT
jgi:hypothetical protein